MKKIHKYKLELTDVQRVDMPTEHETVSVQVQKGEVCVWAVVDDASPNKKQAFYIHGTGHDVGDKFMMFIGTVQLADGTLVLHVFEGE